MTTSPARSAASPGTSPGSRWPPFPLGPPTSASWREQALSRIAELRFVLELMQRSGDLDMVADGPIKASLNQQLDDAAKAAKGGSTFRPRQFLAALTGSEVERVISQLDAVENELLRVAPADYLTGELSSLLAHIQLHLRANDPRRLRVETIASRCLADELHTGAQSYPARKGSRRLGRARIGVGPAGRAEAIPAESDGTPALPALSERDRQAVISAVRAASAESRWKVSRLRSFRNVIVITAVVLAIAAVGVTVFAFRHPSQLPLCFIPANVVCTTSTTRVPGAAQETVAGQAAPAAQARAASVMEDAASGWDVAVVEIVGLVAAAIAAAAALRNVHGTSTPYSLPVALAVLKLPTGALTALLGLLLMRGGFVPGLSALDTSAQIVAWALVFGYAQQLFTRLVDNQAQTVLEGAGGDAKSLPAPTAMVVAEPAHGSAGSGTRS